MCWITSQIAGNLDVARSLGVLEIQVDLNFVDSKLVSEFPDCVTLKVFKNGTKTPVRLLSVLRRKRDREAYFGTDEYGMTRVRLIEGTCVELFKALNSKAKGVIKDKIDDYIRGERLCGTETLIVHLDEISPVAELNFNYNVTTSGKGSKIYRSENPIGGDWRMPGENADYPKLRVGFDAKKKDSIYGYSSTTSYSYTTAKVNNDGIKFHAIPFDNAPPIKEPNHLGIHANALEWDALGNDPDIDAVIAQAKAKIKAEKIGGEMPGKPMPGGFFFQPDMKGPIKAEPVPVPPQKIHAKPIPDNEIWIDDDEVEF